jgi:uncharacterized phage-associated protein
MTEKSSINTYKVINVANSFINIFNEHKKQLSHKKLQKLIYLAHGFRLLFNNKPLVEEEFEAWAHGPVCRDLYTKIKRADYSPYKITQTLKEDNNLSENDKKNLESIANYIYGLFGDWSADELELLTHRKGSAWDKVYNYKSDDIKIYLEEDDIKNEMQTIINELKNAK